MIQIFKYINELDCFIVTDEYKTIVNKLGVSEWNEVVWIGRFFTLDNDYGEHWFDNWEERDKIADKARALGLDYGDLLIIKPERFKNGKDGPCHTDLERINFWTDVLKSLKLSIETIFLEARKLNEQYRWIDEESFVPDLETRIEAVKNSYKQ